MANSDNNKSGSFLEELLVNGQIAWRLYTDPRVSLILKLAVPMLALLYFIVPIDLLPDFIPFVGQLDEVALVLLLVRLFVAVAPPDIVAEYRRQAKGGGSTAGSSSTASGSAQKPGNNGTSKQTRADDVVDADFRVVNDN